MGEPPLAGRHERDLIAQEIADRRWRLSTPTGRDVLLGVGLGACVVAAAVATWTIGWAPAVLGRVGVAAGQRVLPFLAPELRHPVEVAPTTIAILYVLGGLAGAMAVRPWTGWRRAWRRRRGADAIALGFTFVTVVAGPALVRRPEWVLLVVVGGATLWRLLTPRAAWLATDAARDVGLWRDPGTGRAALQPDVERWVRLRAHFGVADPNRLP